jgi:hypothetical protein
VKNRFQSLPFKCNLQRYTSGSFGSQNFVDKIQEEQRMEEQMKVGLYKYNPVDPKLESAWFQPF